MLRLSGASLLPLSQYQWQIDLSPLPYLPNPAHLDINSIFMIGAAIQTQSSSVGLSLPPISRHQIR
jgi:hypothetical protein